MNNLLKCNLLFGFILMLVLSACAPQEPIKVGFSAELTGGRSDLGVDGRDGVQLAVEIINEQGGINGRPVELIVKDDKGDPEVARQVDAELAKAGVVAILGHMTSGQTSAVFDQNNQAQVVMLSPTASSIDFSNKADHFFRVIPTNEFMGQALAKHIAAKGFSSLAIVYDLSNLSYTEPLALSAQAEFEQLGGQVSQPFTFKSGETDLQTLIGEVQAARPDSIIFISSAVDTAVMAQYLRQNDPELPIYAVPWAQTPELIQKGGKSVEGLELTALYNPQNDSAEFKEFSQKFEARYGRTPTFPAAFSYDAALTLLEGLKQTKGQAEGLTDALTGISNIAGLQGSISLNEYGDVLRGIHIAAVENGEFKVIDTIEPES